MNENGSAVLQAPGAMISNQVENEMSAAYADCLDQSTGERYYPSEDDYYDMAIADAETALSRLRRDDRQAILDRIIKEHEEALEPVGGGEEFSF